jgi:mannose-6-phosphate isomerase-like protein (cupin superfamily)
MKADFFKLLQQLPGPKSEKWPHGARFTRALAHGTMSVELYAPIGFDPQTPHDQDELYFIAQGFGEIVIANQRHGAKAGMVFFVPAGTEHRFENFSYDFATWVVFWGEKGGESN